MLNLLLGGHHPSTSWYLWGALPCFLMAIRAMQQKTDEAPRQVFWKWISILTWLLAASWFLYEYLTGSSH